MMPGIKHSILLLLLSALLIPACTEEIEIELDTTYKRLVVNGRITTDTAIHSVKLTSTTDYFYNQSPPPVSNATVTISYDDTVIELEEDPDRPGVYNVPTAFPGIPGTAYELTIKGVDVDSNQVEEVYTAVATMPEPLYIDSIQAQRFISPFFSGYQITHFGQDPQGTQFYSFKLLRNMELITKRLSDYIVQTDDFFNGQYIVGVPVGFLGDDNESEAIVPGDTVTLELNSISKTYYDFILEAQNEIFGNNPLFSGPPANVQSNISNGAQGIFTAYTIHRASRVISLPPF
jgi:hypothetical protein